jgi:hypothetical protein
MDVAREMTPLEKPLEYLLEPLQLGRKRALRLGTRRRRAKVTAIAIVGAAAVAGSAVAALTYLGQPAPPPVKKAFRADNAAKGAFQDAPLRVPLVDVNSAQTVAISGNSVLYGAQGASGNYCTVLLTNGRPARIPNVQCEFGVYPKAMRVDYEKLVSPRDASAPLVLSGRLSGAGRTLTAQYTSGLIDRVSVGLRGYFVYQPAAGLQRDAKTSAIRLVERNRFGTITDTQLLQPPIILAKSSPVSPHIVKGRLFIPGARYVAVTLVALVSNSLSQPEGQVAMVPVGRDGRFAWHAPKSVPKRYEVALRVMDSHFGVLVDLGP